MAKDGRPFLVNQAICDHDMGRQHVVGVTTDYMSKPDRRGRFPVLSKELRSISDSVSDNITPSHRSTGLS